MDELTCEQWRPVDGFPGYLVSDQGRVRSVDRVVRDRRWGSRRVRGAALHPSVDRYGYSVVVLHRDGVRHPHTVASLVLTAFVGPRPSGMWALHGPGGNRADDRFVNLRWGTPEDNARDRDERDGHNANARKVRCKRGHRFTEENTRWERLVTGRWCRRCRTCRKRPST